MNAKTFFFFILFAHNLEHFIEANYSRLSCATCWRHLGLLTLQVYGLLLSRFCSDRVCVCSSVSSFTSRFRRQWSVNSGKIFLASEWRSEERTSTWKRAVRDREETGYNKELRKCIQSSILLSITQFLRIRFRTEATRTRALYCTVQELQFVFLLLSLFWFSVKHAESKLARQRDYCFVRAHEVKSPESIY
jgi:hypothetical protein